MKRSLLMIVFLSCMVVSFTGCAWLATHSPELSQDQINAIATAAGQAAGTAAAAAAAKGGPLASNGANMAGAGVGSGIVLALGGLYTWWRKKYRIVDTAKGTNAVPAA